MKKIWLLLVIVTALFPLFFVSITFHQALAKEIVPIVTPGSGGTAYMLGAGVGTIARKYVPEVDCMVQAESGVTTMLKQVHEYWKAGKPALTVCDGNGIWSAYNSAGLFAGKEKYSELRGITFLHSVELYFVVKKKSGIKSYGDVKGKRIAVGPPGSSVGASGLLLFNAHGLTEKDFKPVYLSYSETVEGVANGSIDGGILAGSAPIASYNELALTQDVTIIPVRADVIKSITEKYLYFYPVTVAKGTYKGLDNDVPTVAFSSILATHEQTSPDVVYKLVKAIYEHKGDLVAVHKAAQEITKKNALAGIGVPIHQGAQKYFREIGIMK
jgi:TRAP transporter TAXI family solute receptor